MNTEDYINSLTNGGYTRGVPGTGNIENYINSLKNGGYTRGERGYFEKVSHDDRTENEPTRNEDGTEDRAGDANPAPLTVEAVPVEPAGELQKGSYAEDGPTRNQDGTGDRAGDEPAGNESGGYTHGVNGDSNIADYIASLKNGGYTRGVRGTFYDEDGNEISPNDLFGDHAANEPGRGEIPQHNSTPMPTQEIDNGTAHLPIA